jgi:hypothetical protein
MAFWSAVKLCADAAQFRFIKTNSVLHREIIIATRCFYLKTFCLMSYIRLLLPRKKITILSSIGTAP